MKVKTYLEYWKYDSKNKYLASEILDEFIYIKDFKGAIQFYESCTEDMQSNNVLKHKYALANMAENNFDSALMSLKEIDGPENEIHNIRYNIAFCFYAKGSIELAIDELESAPHIWSECIQIYLLLARCYRLNSNYLKAEVLVNEYLEISPDCTQGRGLRALLFSDVGHFDKAIKLSEQVIEAEPSQLESLSALTTSLIATKDFEKALICLESAIYFYPYATAFYRDKTIVLISQGKLQEAHRAISSAIDLGTNDVQLFFIMGLVLMLCHEYDLSIQFLNEVLKIYPMHMESICCKIICSLPNCDYPSDIDRLTGEYEELLNSTNHILAKVAKSLILRKQGKYYESHVEINEIFKSNTLYDITIEANKSIEGGSSKHTIH